MLKNFKEDNQYSYQPSPQPSPLENWFNQARFGLFIHWGIYSLLGHENAEWVLFKSALNRDEYNHLANQFTAVKFDANALAKLAKRAGMNYMVLTTKHHDGFCLYDTKTTDFNSVKTVANRDFVKEFVEACHSHNLRVGLYHSVMSWQQPAIYTGPGADPKGWERMVQETHNQVKELMSNYGKIDMLWYDGAVIPGIQDKGMQAKFWRSHELNKMVKKLQPEILINNRSGLPADYDTPEQHVKPPETGRRWEACMTINQSWGYNIHDRNYKSSEEIINCLIRCSRYQGNLLLNIGPRADGTIQQECIERLKAVGDWLKRNGEAIYNSNRTTYTEADHIAGPTTQKDEKIYIHIKTYPGNAILVDAVGNVDRAFVLGFDSPLTINPGIGNSVIISGLKQEFFNLGPAVICLVPKTDLSKPAKLLGGGDELRVEAGNAPVLGDDPDRHAPPVEPVISNELLKTHLDSSISIKTQKSQNWCPGWLNWQIFSPRTDNELSVNFEVKVAGKYTLDLGIICDNDKDIQISLSDQSLNQTISLSNSGCPDTISFTNLKLSAGNKTLTITSNNTFGLYAYRLSPIWTPLSSDKWHVLGPFPTKFGPQKPTTEVRNALQQQFISETVIDLTKPYQDPSGNKISWTHSSLQEGEHTDCGVNFPYRCSTDVTGVCYAYTTISSPTTRKATILIGCDWWANARINGELVTTTRDPELIETDGAQFETWKPRPAQITLKKG